MTTPDETNPTTNAPTERKKYTANELKAILDLHRKWRFGEVGGSRADLSGANLSRAYLSDADLSRAYLSDADLSGADLSDADLSRADLSGADLSDAYLSRAYLSGADLSDAYLSDAYLSDANLSGADLSGADLSRADLSRANLSGADLSDADLSRAYLSGADLSRAYLSGADLSRAIGIGAEQAAAGATTAPPAGTRPTFDRAAAAARYRELHPEVPVVPQLDARILEVVESGKGELDMGSWHSCETTHCRAGWAITLAGIAGAALEGKYGSERAGAMIYRASTGRVPYFFGDDETALKDIRKCAAEQVKAAVEQVTPSPEPIAP